MTTINNNTNVKTHTRPKIRKRPQQLQQHRNDAALHGHHLRDEKESSSPSIVPSSNMVDDLLEQTRQRISSSELLLGPRSIHSSKQGLLEGILGVIDDDNNNNNDSISNKLSSYVKSSTDRTNVTTLKSKQQNDKHEDQKNVKKNHIKGILKKETKYQNNTKDDNVNNKKVVVSQSTQGDKQSQQPISTTSIKTNLDQNSTSTLVKDIIVERPFPKADPYPNESNSDEAIMYNSTQVEGYIPKEDQTTIAQNNKEMKTSKDTTSDSSDNENITDLGNGSSMIETDMEFKCMTEAEFKSAVEVSVALGISVDEFLVQQQKIIDEEKGTKEHRNSPCSTDENNSSDSESTDEEEFGDENQQDDFFSFFGTDSDNDEDRDEPSNDRKHTPFMILWNALSKWITPKSVQVLQKYRNDLFDKNQEKYSPVIGVDDTNNAESSDASSNYNNDIAASRCEGLMTMIKMNLSKALMDLEYKRDTNDKTNGLSDEYIRQNAHMRLGEFIQSFDFSESMVKLDSKMWLALTVLLLDMLLPISTFHDGRNSNTNEDDENYTKTKLPSSIITIGIHDEEYDYLIRTAVPTLSKGLL